MLLSPLHRLQGLDRLGQDPRHQVRSPATGKGA